MTETKIEFVPISELRPYEKNPRTHSSEQVRKLVASMQEFGWTVPVLVDGGGEVIAGHGRLIAAETLGLEQVPIIRLEHLTPAQARAYRIADNQLTLLGGWDEESLVEELQALEISEFDLSLLGFSDEELEQLLQEDGAEGEAENETLPRTTLADRFGIAPFSVFNAREGWWQNRKRSWIALGIQSEIGRGEELTWAGEEVNSPGLNHYRDKAKLSPGGSPMPAADYSKRERGDGSGKPMRNLTPGGGGMGKRSVWGHGGRPNKKHLET